MTWVKPETSNFSLTIFIFYVNLSTSQLIFLCILVPASLFLYQVIYLHQISAVENLCADWCYLWKFHFIWCKFSIIKTGAGTTPFTVANWDECMEKHQHQSHPKNTFFIFTFLVQINCQYDVHFRYGWERNPL